MLVAYVSGHGFGHATRACEVLAAVRARAPALRIAIVSAVPERILRGAVPGALEVHARACDVGLAQRDALVIDEAETARRCSAFEASWEERVAAEAAFLRAHRARVVMGDIPPLAFAAAAAAGMESLALGNFSWDWIYRHLSARQPSLAASADRAAEAYRHASLLLELPFAGDLSAFPRRERIGLVARRPRVPRAAARQRLGLDERPAVLVSFGGIGLPGLDTAALARDGRYQWLLPQDLGEARLDALGLGYPDVVGAAEVVVTKPGYGIVSDAIGAGARMVYTERGDFPEYPVMVAELPRHLPCVHVSNDELRAGRLAPALEAVLALPARVAPELDGARRAAERIVAYLGG
jgi:L-arabinokinase